MIFSRSLSCTRRSLLALGAAGLAGCSVLPDVNKPLTIYTLSPQAAPAGQLPKVTWQLVVAEPSAERDIDTTRIALTRKPNVIEYFAGGEWSDTAPKLVQAKLIEAFEATHAILAVGPDAAGLKPDYILQPDLRDFEAEYPDGDTAAGAPANAHVRLISKLVAMPDRRITRTVAAEASVQAAGRDLPDIVVAFQQALGQVLGKTVTEILSTG